MPSGRPTDYSPAILKKAKAYLNACKDEEVELVKQSGKGKNGSYKIIENKLKIHLPSIEGLARYLGVARSTVYKWRDEHQDFSDMLEEILQEQHQRLLDNGLSGDYNSTIAKLVLSKHGYSDKQEVEHSGFVSLTTLFDEASKQ